MSWGVFSLAGKVRTSHRPLFALITGYFQVHLCFCTHNLDTPRDCNLLCTNSQSLQSREKVYINGDLTVLKQTTEHTRVSGNEVILIHGAPTAIFIHWSVLRIFLTSKQFLLQLLATWANFFLHYYNSVDVSKCITFLTTYLNVHKINKIYTYFFVLAPFQSSPFDSVTTIITISLVTVSSHYIIFTNIK